MLFEDIKKQFEESHQDLELLGERFIQTKTKKRREFHILNKSTGFDFWCQESRLNKYNYSIIRYENYEALKKYINRITKGEYVLLTPCKKFSDKVDILHTRCQKIHSYRISHFCNDKSRCPDCKNKALAKTNNEFDKYLETINPQKNLERISDYINSKADITIRCKKCGKTFITKPNNLTRQYAEFSELHCPNCQDDYYGEKMINEILLSFNLKEYTIKRQYSNPECRYKRPLRFDFAIISNNDPNSYPVALIEYDGSQHFDPTSKYAILDDFKKIKERDSIKDNFCKEKNIPFLRLSSYNKSRTQKILTDFLKDNNITF